MIKKELEKIKSSLKKQSETNNKKKIENLVFFLILLIITIIAINTIWDKDVKEEDNNINNKKLAEEAKKSNIIESNEYNLEENLQNILSKIEGVGQVNALITYSQTSEIVPVYNENSTTSNTEETDTNGGKRTITESNSSKEVVMTGEGDKELITSKVVMPKVEGAIIIAEGAKDINIKASIIKAVSAVTGLAEYKVQVFEKN